MAGINVCGTRTCTWIQGYVWMRVCLCLPAEGCCMNIIGNPVGRKLSRAPSTSFITPITTKTPSHGRCINTTAAVPNKQICARHMHFQFGLKPAVGIEFWGLFLVRTDILNTLHQNYFFSRITVCCDFKSFFSQHLNDLQRQTIVDDINDDRRTFM